MSEKLFRLVLGQSDDAHDDEEGRVWRQYYTLTADDLTDETMGESWEDSVGLFGFDPRNLPTLLDDNDVRFPAVSLTRYLNLVAGGFLPNRTLKTQLLVQVQGEPGEMLDEYSFDLVELVMFFVGRGLNNFSYREATKPRVPTLIGEQNSTLEATDSPYLASGCTW